eukprot:3119254-Amphidinium_carterae.2
MGGTTKTRQQHQQETQGEICFKSLHTLPPHNTSTLTNSTAESTQVLQAPAAVMLRLVLCLAHVKKYQIYFSDIASAFRNTPEQQGTTILVQPPAEFINVRTTKTYFGYWQLIAEAALRSTIFTS